MAKKFQDLDLKNAFLFTAAMEDEETCQIVLETILGKKIGRVKVDVEHTILYSSDIHSIRLDVYAGDTAQVDYDIEMQNDDKEDLARRSRYYQGQMDIARLKPGQDYHDLQPNYVIFICTFDPFGRGLYRYTYEMCCKETGEPLQDGICRIFLSTKGKNKGEVPEELVHFLGYVEQSTDSYVKEHEDESLNRLHEKISKLKKNRGLEGRYMTVEELLKKRERQGLEQGQERMGQLCQLMRKDGRLEEFGDATEKPELLEKLFTEYGL